MEKARLRARRMLYFIGIGVEVVVVSSVVGIVPLIAPNPGVVRKIRDLSG